MGAVLAAEQHQQSSGSRPGCEDRAVLPHPLLLPFPAELLPQNTELSVNTNRDFFFSPSCIRKQSDLSVLVICLQLSWQGCTSQETNIFLINFPVTFYRCCKLHWSYPFSVHCNGLWVCNRAQSILCSQFRVFAAENCYLIIFIKYLDVAAVDYAILLQNY